MVAVFRARDGASRRRLLVLEALLVASVAVTLGVAARVVYLESLETTNLVWNLFLAWIPLVLALVVYDGARRGWPAGTLAAVGLGWLLFLPNAPYIVTDLKWLGHYDSGTHWFDPMLIGAAAAIGLVPREDSSAERRHRGHITKAGPAPLRSVLVQAAWVYWRVTKRGAVRAWVDRLAARRGKRIAVVALARRLSRMLFAIWRDETVYREPRAA